MAPQQPDDAAFNAKLRSFDIRFLETNFQSLLEVELQTRDRVLARVRPGDGDAGHGDDERIGRRLRDVDVAAAGVRERFPTWCHVAVPGAQADSDCRSG